MIETDTTVGIATMTDADWGRLYNFNSAGDAGLIMPFRSYYIRDFFSGGWSDIALGLIHCECGNTGDYSALVAERQDESQTVNLPHFGLSKSLGGSIDVANNPHFIGIRGIKGSVTQVMSSPDQIAFMQPILVNGAFENPQGAAIIVPLSTGINSTPFTMWGLRLTFDSLTGTAYLNFATQTGVSVTDDADNITVLNTFLQGISNAQSDAIASFPIANVKDFSTFYIFWPYLKNKIKLQCVGVVKLG